MAAFKSFGAMPIALPFGEQFTALQQGTIDACENGVSGCYTNGFYEVTKNITNTHHVCLLYTSISKDFFVMLMRFG